MEDTKQTNQRRRLAMDDDGYSRRTKSSWCLWTSQVGKPYGSAEVLWIMAWYGDVEGNSI